MDLSVVYFPSAIALGALHALEPGHAKTLTAAYLIGTKGTGFDAVLLGLSVAVTHSLVVVALCVGAVWLGRETFTDEASHWLAILSGAVVVVLGVWLLRRRIRIMRRASRLASHRREHHRHEHHHDHEDGHGHDHPHEHDHPHQDHEHDHCHDHEHDHALMTDDEHARAHAATLPAYVHAGERPTAWQIMAFGGAGGLIPCPAAVTVMLLSLSVAQTGNGLFLVAGFSIGLAITLVGVGLAVVLGLSKLSGTGRLSWLSGHAPAISAVLVILSGLVGLTIALVGH